MGTTDTDFSRFVSNAMDILGYSNEMVKQRRQMPSLLGDFILAGSTGDGTTSYFESDLDVMVEMDDVICTDIVSKYRSNPDPDLEIFELNLQDASPGYALLRYAQDSPDMSDFDEFLEEVGENCFFLQSANLIRYGRILMKNDSCEGDGISVLPVTGPSVPGSLYGIPFDFVMAYKCDCSVILKEFLMRPRKYKQPSDEVLHQISQLDAHVVPIGNISGDNAHIEWRICYTKAEILLLHQLNETQIKLYILLKLLSKSALVEYKDISSYIMKNIVFWMAELIPIKQFKNEYLVQRLKDALTLLKLSVKHSYLPNYMIPSRNLLCRKFKRHEQIKALKLLSDMTNEGGCVLFRCHRLKEAMLILYKSPQQATRIGNIRDTFEQWFTFMCGTDPDIEDEGSELMNNLARQYYEHEQYPTDGSECTKVVVNALSKLHQIIL